MTRTGHIVAALPSIARACAILLVGLLASAAAHATRLIDPGEPVRLKDNEGLLVVSADTDIDLARLRFDRIGTAWDGAVFRSVKKGVTTRLYAVPAGRYRWTKATQIDTWSFTATLDMSKDREFEFDIRPGRINYAGDLVYRSTGFLSANVRLANRALPAMDWLQAQHPTAVAQWGFEYTGHYPDPFPSFYAQLAKQAGAAASLDAVRAAPKPAVPLPLSPRELWRPASTVDVALSPDGALVAYVMREEIDAPAEPKRRRGDDAAPDASGKTVRWTLLLYDAVLGRTLNVMGSEIPIETVLWESDRTLLAWTDTPRGNWLHALHVGDSAGDTRPVRRVDGPVGGRIVDLLPSEPGVVLYQKRDSRGETLVQRLQLADKDGVRRFERAGVRDRLNVGVERDITWFADGSGRLRAAYARRGEDDVVLMHGRDGVFHEVLTLDAQGGFVPVGLSFDGERIYGFIETGRAQRDFVEFDPARKAVVATVHSKPGIDLVSAVFDDRRRPIGVRYYRDGRLLTDYFDEHERHLDGLLRKAFPERSVATLERSRDANTAVLWVDGIDQPPQIYLLDVRRRHAQLFEDSAPHLANHRFAPAQVLKVRGSDGLPIDAFLTMPPGDGKRPLVVMAHGGPIGVSDDLHFNREVQFIASLGYAVLQVNFRGSDGYGTAFREAGHRNYGRMIEDDIDAAVNAVLASHPIDASRMCTLGSSYGGYSAMVSTIRWPGRFRCAVSISGVSDRALFFTASDSGRDADTRQEMEKIMGNPTVAADLDDMRATSPLYRYTELTAPLMLVHGRDDARVDYEHTRRLVRLLNLAGRTPVAIAFEDEGHSLADLDHVEAAWSGIAAFLQQHLGTPASAATTRADAVTGAAGAP